MENFEATDENLEINQENTPEDSETSSLNSQEEAHEEKESQGQHAKTYKLSYDDQEHEITGDQAFEFMEQFLGQRDALNGIIGEWQDQKQHLEALKNKDFSVLNQLGLDQDELLTTLTEIKAEREAMSPEQIEVQELKAELEKYERMQADHEQKQLEEQKKLEEEAFTQLVQQQDDAITNSIIKSLEGSDLPQTPETVMRMGDLMYQALNNGENVDPSDLVQIVKESYHNEFSGLAQAMSGEQLCQMLGEDALKKIRDFDLGRVRKQAPVPQTPSQAVNPDNSPSRAWISEDELEQQVLSNL